MKKKEDEWLDWCCLVCRENGKGPEMTWNMEKHINIYNPSSILLNKMTISFDYFVCLSFLHKMYPQNKHKFSIIAQKGLYCPG